MAVNIYQQIDELLQWRKNAPVQFSESFAEKLELSWNELSQKLDEKLLKEKEDFLPITKWKNSDCLGELETRAEMLFQETNEVVRRYHNLEEAIGMKQRLDLNETHLVLEKLLRNESMTLDVKKSAIKSKRMQNEAISYTEKKNVGNKKNSLHLKHTKPPGPLHHSMVMKTNENAPDESTLTPRRKRRSLRNTSAKF